MKKQCLIIVGNIAAGKTAVCRAWLSKSLHYSFVCLDDYRDIAHVFTPPVSAWGNEQMAQKLALNPISDEEPFLLFETTGTGRFFDRALRQLIVKGYQIRMVHLQCDPDECLKRFHRRSYKGYILPPYPYKFKPHDTIRHISAAHRQLRFDHIFNTQTSTAEEIVESLSQLVIK